MHRLTLRLMMGLITFTVGVTVVFLWLLSQTSSSDTIPPIIKSKGSNLQSIAFESVLLSTVTRGRDLFLYDRGGEYCCGGFILESARHLYAEPMAKARAFIWQHWQEKRRGYIIVKLYGDDNEDLAHFFVEPDNQGTWHIACRILRDLSYGDDLKWPSVEWRRAKKDDSSPSGTLILVFKDENGEEGQTL